MKKINVFKKVMVLSLACLVGCGSLLGCSTESKVIQEGDTIVIGYDYQFAPMGFNDSDLNEDVGFDLDLASAVMQEIGYDYKLQRIDWSTKETELNTGNIDLIWNGYTISEAREELVDFSIPYLKNDQVVVIRIADSATYTTQESMVGVKIALQNGSTAVDAVEESDLSNNDVIKLSTNVDVLTELMNGNDSIEIAVMDSVVARYYLEVNSNFASTLMVVEDVVLANEEYGIGVRKSDTALKELINNALYTLKDNGTLQEIADVWGLADDLIV